MTKKLGAAAAFLLAVVVGVVFMSRPPDPPVQVAEDCVEGVLDPRVPVIGKVCGEPGSAPILDEPLEPTKPPDLVPVIWGPCENSGTLSGRQRAEDAHLVKILASNVDNDPLFGGPEWAMQSAECSARRERLAWMGSR